MDMELKDLMAISGYPGLYRFVSQGRNAIIVESLDDKKRMSAYSTQRISTLEEISVYTGSGELPLADVFRKIHNHNEGREAPDPKSPPAGLKEFFGVVLPEYDRERVYVSDIKKILSWYNILLRHDLPGLLARAEENKDKPQGSDESEGEAETGAEAKSKAENKAESKTGAKPQAKAKTKAKPQVKAGAKPPARAKTVAKPQAKGKGDGNR